jgi:hypothetical protein
MDSWPLFIELQWRFLPQAVALSSVVGVDSASAAVYCFMAVSACFIALLPCCYDSASVH